MITSFWGARHGQGVTSLVAHAASVLSEPDKTVRIVDADPDCADLTLWAPKETQDGSVSVDRLLEEAEVSQAVSWPEWAPWRDKVTSLGGNPHRSHPLAPSRDAAQRFWNALVMRDSSDQTILVDAGSGMRDYLTLLLLSNSSRIVVVARSDTPDLLVAHHALQYIGGHLQATDKVLAVIGLNAGAQEVLHGIEGFRFVQIPELSLVHEARNTGKLVSAAIRTPAAKQYLQAVAKVVESTPSEGANKSRRRGPWKR